MANTTNEAFQQFLLWESTTRDTLDVKKIYMDIAGDPMAGIALSELLYWYLPDKNGGVSKLRIEKPKEKGGPVYQWIAVRRYEWWDRCRFSPEQADYALRKLIERGLIEKKVFKFDGEPTVHIRLIEDAFLQAFSRLSANPPVNPYLPQKPELGNFPKRIGTPPPENPPNWEISQNELGNFPKTINIDYITPPPHSADAENAEIPQTIVEAAKHPDIALVRTISGNLPDNRSDWREIIDRMTLIRRERPEMDEEALRAEGGLYWRAWHERGYTSPGWLSWWANRRIPAGRGKKRTTRQANSAIPADPAAPALATPTQIARTPAVAPPPQYVFDAIAARRKLPSRD
ncbi:MAG: hypothetical protein AB1509_15725 [Chloroflexota bacterium]